jgi:hypothetical protein
MYWYSEFSYVAEIVHYCAHLLPRAHHIKGYVFDFEGKSSNNQIVLA